MSAVTASRGHTKLALQREVARELAGPRRVSEVLTAVMSAVARTTEAARAETWMVAPGGDRLVLLAHWGEDGGAWATLHERNERAEPTRGEGLVGAVWMAERAAHARCDEDGQARRALAFVVPLASSPCAIMAFYTDRLEEPEPGVLEALDAIGVQVGAMLGRFELERAVQESDERRRLVFDAIPSAVIVLDRGGRIVDWNRTAERMLAHAAEDVLGLSVVDVLAPPRWRSRFDRALGLLYMARGVTLRVRVPVRTGRDVERIVQLGVAHVEDDVAPGLVVTAEDVTARITRERALRRALRDARRVARERDDLGAVFGHELHNPLAAIAMASERMGQPDDDATEQAREVIERQASDAVRLVDELLDLSRAQRGTLAVERAPVSLRRVLDLALERSAPALRERDHRLSVRAPVGGVWLLGDQARLAQVFANLLNNAARYTPRGGHVQLEAGLESGEIVVRVHDDGIGMTAELCDAAFQPFRQGPRAGAADGLGLGLALVRSIVELHGGSVSASSEGLGAGSTFEVRLPWTSSGDPS